jgi:hypothetical protein
MFQILDQSIKASSFLYAEGASVAEVLSLSDKVVLIVQLVAYLFLALMILVTALVRKKK